MYKISMYNRQNIKKMKGRKRKNCGRYNENTKEERIGRFKRDIRKGE